MKNLSKTSLPKSLHRWQALVEVKIQNNRTAIMDQKPVTPIDRLLRRTLVRFVRYSAICINGLPMQSDKTQLS